MALTQVKALGLAADLIDETKLADNSIDSEHYNDGSIDNAHLADDAVDTDEIADDAVTADKLANSINTEIAANTAKVTNATHSGEVTGATALTIADDVVDEANLKADNSPTNDYVLTAKSSAAGGLTWAAASGGISDVVSDTTPQLGGDLDVNGNQIKGDDVQIHAADDQVIAKFHKTNSSEFHFNGTKKLEVNNTGIAVTGSITPSGGLYLGGSGGSNYLDDYEEGTFTPLLGGDNYGTYNVTGTGKYTRVGRMVHVEFKFHSVDLDNSASGQVRVRGWPFAINRTDSRPQCGSLMMKDVVLTTSHDEHTYFLYGEDADSMYGLISRDDANWDGWNVNCFHKASLYLEGTFSYMV